MGLGVPGQRARSSSSRWSPSACVVPTSRDPHVHRFDPLGIVLSIAGVTVLVWAVIEAPKHGWTSPTSLGRVRASPPCCWPRSSWWERRSDHPMLDVRRVHQHALHRRQPVGDVRVLRPVRVHLHGHPVLPVRAGLRHARGRRAHGAVRAVHRHRRAAVGAKLAAALRHEGDRGRRAWSSMAIGFVRSPATIGGRLALLAHRRVDVLHGRRPRPGQRAGDRGDHGLAAAGQGRRRLGGQRHDPRARRHARRGHRRQPVRLGLRQCSSLWVPRLAGAHPEAVAAIAQDSVGAAYAVAEQAPAPFGDAMRVAAASSFMDGFGVGLGSPPEWSSSAPSWPRSSSRPGPSAPTRPRSTTTPTTPPPPTTPPKRSFLVQIPVALARAASRGERDNS